MDAIVKALGRIESLLARTVNPPAKHGAGVPPWHMWGGTQSFQVRQQGGVTSPLVPTPGQIARLGYGRPESWHCMLAAKLLAGPDTAAVGQHVVVNVLWDLTLGIGRSVIILPAFATFHFEWNDGAAFPQDQQIWTTETDGPNRSFATGGGAVSSNPSVCDSFVAQDIQCNARIFLQELSVAGSPPVTVELQAQFAPIVHQRPEWHLHNFPGGEEK